VGEQGPCVNSRGPSPSPNADGARPLPHDARQSPPGMRSTSSPPAPDQLSDHPIHGHPQSAWTDALPDRHYEPCCHRNDDCAARVGQGGEKSATANQPVANASTESRENEMRTIAVIRPSAVGSSASVNRPTICAPVAAPVHPPRHASVMPAEYLGISLGDCHRCPRWRRGRGRLQ